MCVESEQKRFLQRKKFEIIFYFENQPKQNKKKRLSLSNSVINVMKQNNNDDNGFSVE